MMKPENSHKQDVINMLLEKSWEDPSSDLKVQLESIPGRFAMSQNRSLDRISSILNAILVLWSAGLVIFFWVPLDTFIKTFTIKILGFSSLSPQLLAHPIIPGIILACLLLAWVLLDTDRHPRSN